MTPTPSWLRHAARALPAQQVASPLAAGPYDLRHTAASTWLNAGVPATQVAERAGHSVEVLLSIYAKCIEGDGARHRSKIDAALGPTRQRPRLWRVFGAALIEAPSTMPTPDISA